MALGSSAAASSLAARSASEADSAPAPRPLIAAGARPGPARRAPSAAVATHALLLSVLTNVSGQASVSASSGTVGAASWITRPRESGSIGEDRKGPAEIGGASGKIGGGWSKRAVLVDSCPPPPPPENLSRSCVASARRRLPRLTGCRKEEQIILLPVSIDEACEVELERTVGRVSKAAK
jgi:hypothetical protein